MPSNTTPRLCYSHKRVEQQNKEILDHHTVPGLSDLQTRANDCAYRRVPECPHPSRIKEMRDANTPTRLDNPRPRSGCDMINARGQPQKTHAAGGGNHRDKEPTITRYSTR